MYTQGGSVITSSCESFETSNQLTGWTSENLETYQHGGTTSRVVSQGTTSLNYESNLEQSLTSTQVTNIKSTGGKINIHQSGGIWTTQTNSSPYNCIDGDIVEQGGELTSRYPETQDATTFIGMLGGGDSWYESELLIDDKSLAMSMAGGTEEGFLYANSEGEILAGLDTNSTSLQYRYKRSDRLIKLSKNHQLAEAVASFIWDESVDEVAEQTNTTETQFEETE